MKLAVCVIIKHPDSDLYVGVSRKTDPTDFGLPGGKVDEGETIQEAIVRETQEETGITINNLKVVSIIQEDDYLTYCFSCDYTQPTGDFITSEVGIVKWVQPEEIFAGSFGKNNIVHIQRYKLIK